jgi:small GTP-binding protein
MTDTPRFKVVLFGEAGVGKTAIHERFRDRPFRMDIRSTLAPETASAILETERGPVRIDLLDTAGQERYLSLAPLYFRDADAVLLVADASDPSTTKSLARLMAMYERHLRAETLQVLAVNKIDLDPDFDRNEVTNFCDGRILPLFFVSARDGCEIRELFTFIATKLMENPAPVKVVQPLAIEQRGCC